MSQRPNLDAGRSHARTLAARKLAYAERLLLAPLAPLRPAELERAPEALLAVRAEPLVGQRRLEVHTVEVELRVRNATMQMSHNANVSKKKVSKKKRENNFLAGARTHWKRHPGPSHAIICGEEKRERVSAAGI